MTIKLPVAVVVATLCCLMLGSCTVLRENSKYGFNDGIYQTQRFSDKRVYVLNIDDGDTISVFPVKEYKDSTAILTKQRTDYTSRQWKVKDNKLSRSFYRPSFDVDIMTMPVKYRPAMYGFPNQLNDGFNGALYGGYRIDAYHLHYKRTPLNVYKQDIKHIGYSAGLYAGLGSGLIDGNALGDPNFYIQYQGVLLLTGVAANVAVGNLTFGLAFGVDHLLDKYHSYWIYEGKPNIGLTFGLNLN